MVKAGIHIEGMKYKCLVTKIESTNKWIELENFCTIHIGNNWYSNGFGFFYFQCESDLIVFTIFAYGINAEIIFCDGEEDG
jgi:hypothetical protein